MEQTKEKLIDAAIELIIQQGYEDTSVASIVKKANLAQGTFYLYFQSKYDMVLAIAKRVLGNIDALVSRLDSSVLSLNEFLQEWIHIVYTITEQNKELINYVYSKSAEKQRFSEWEQIYKPYYQWLSQHLQRYQQAGQCHKEFDVTQLAVFLVNTVEQSAEHHYLFQPEVKDANKSIDFVHRFIVESLM